VAGASACAAAPPPDGHTGRPRAVTGATGRGTSQGRRRAMGKVVFAAAMSHVLDPDYYQAACGLSGRRKVEACMAEIGKLGDTFLARRPDALIVIADDHLNAFSFNA